MQTIFSDVYRMIKWLNLVVFSSLLLSCSHNISKQKNGEYINLNNYGKHISVNLKVNQYQEGNFYFDTASPWLIIDSTLPVVHLAQINFYFV